MENASKPTWQHVTEVELIYKTKIKAAQRPQIKDSGSAYRLFRQCWDEGSIELLEEFKVLLMNRANKVLGLLELSKGGVTGTVVDLRLLFGAAVKACAVGMVIAHNHPSGGLKPSETDIALTGKIAAAARLLDMKLLDHLIITADAYFSFADEGLL